MAELFLGEDVDPSTHTRSGTKVLLPSGELTTHGVIVGMTGSGKTGLGVVLIEECLRAGIPTLLIDPKGDLGNLCLTFPELSGAEFRPWINDGDARSAGLDPEQYAAAQATVWREGLAGWGLGAADIAALRASAELTIFTPGSGAGMPVNIVGSLQAPADVSDLETVRDEVEGYVSGLLGLVGVDADPLASREHILLANLIENAWSNGQDLDLGTLVGQVQHPPIRKLGVFELDTFFPPADRMKLAMQLNGLLASPSFAAWAMGPPLDIDALVRTADGRPRASIITTAHLSEAERQFVTTLVLSKLVTWMRRQSGTTDLRLLVYLDEVAGYLPPTAMPPTKRPLMTLMKQARAYGVGVVLSTQNPVDIDYKAISNAGTWMIGRLQTERDKSRLLDGMSAADGGVDLATLSSTISGLGKREFVLRRASKDAPSTFTTRWAMSYLRGPLTRDQIAALTPQQGEATAAAATGPEASSGPAAAPGGQPAAAALGEGETTVMPNVADGIAVRFVDVASPWLATVGARSSGRALAAGVVARVRLRYDDAAADLVHDEEYEAVLYPLTHPVDAAAAIAVDYDARDLRVEPLAPPTFRLSEAPIHTKTYWTKLQRELIAHLVRSRALQLPVNRPMKLYGRPGESAHDFAVRCAAEAERQADVDSAKLHDKYERKLRRAEEQIASAEDRVDVLEEDRKGRRSQEILSGAGSILGGLFGGRGGTRKLAKKVLGQLGGAAGRRSRTATAGQRLEGAERKLASLRDALDELEADLAEELADIDGTWAVKAAEITELSVSLERTDVSIAELVLAWLPVD